LFSWFIFPLSEKRVLFDFYGAGSSSCSNSSALDKTGLEQDLLWGVPYLGYQWSTLLSN